MKPVRIGCSGWMYDSWRGRLYPEREPKRRWLELYAEQFDTVEVNSTFYRLARREAVAFWVARTPQRFTFAVKASRYLTHIKRLTGIEEGIGASTSRSSRCERRSTRSGSLAVARELPPRRRTARALAGAAAGRQAHDRVPPSQLVCAGSAGGAPRPRRRAGDRRSSQTPISIVRGDRAVEIRALSLRCPRPARQLFSKAELAYDTLAWSTGQPNARARPPDPRPRGSADLSRRE